MAWAFFAITWRLVCSAVFTEKLNGHNMWCSTELNSVAAAIAVQLIFIEMMYTIVIK